MRRWFVCWAVLLSLLPTSLQAEPVWQEEWRAFGAADAALTLALGGIVGVSLAIGPPKQPRWNREILLDLPLRRAIGASRSETERAAAHVSDVLVAGLTAMPFADLALATYDHHDVRFAETFSGVALQSLALNFAATNVVKMLAGRARPRQAECFGLEGVECPWREPVSFFSGHSSGAFTGAGLVCAHQTIASPHGEGIAGYVPCVSALTVATTVAVLRVIANKHHLSDVLVGSVVGLGAGWGWPLLRFGVPR